MFKSIEYQSRSSPRTSLGVARCKLAAQLRPQFVHVGLAHDLEQHFSLLFLLFSHRALLGLLQITESLYVLEVLDLLHEGLVLFRAGGELLWVDIFLLGQELVRVIQQASRRVQGILPVEEAVVEEEAML